MNSSNRGSHQAAQLSMMQVTLRWYKYLLMWTPILTLNVIMDEQHCAAEENLDTVTEILKEAGTDLEKEDDDD